MRLIAIIVAAAAIAGCTTLPELGRCGNGVVEAQLGEACDDGSDLCDVECRLACVDGETAVQGEHYVNLDPEDDDDNPSTSFEPGDKFCPDGQACGADDVCRAPSGKFRSGGDPIFVDADAITVGDVDDDDLTDVIGISDSRVRVFYGGPDDSALVTQVEQPIPLRTGEAFAVDLAGDGSTDLVIPTIGGILRLISSGGVLAQAVGLTYSEFDTMGVASAAIELVSAAQRNGDHVALGVVPLPGGPRPVLLNGVPLPQCVVGGGTMRPGLAQVGSDNGDLFAVVVDDMSSTDVTACIFEPDLTTQGWRPSTVTLPGVGRASGGTVVFARVNAGGCPSLLVPVAEDEVIAISPGPGCDFASATTSTLLTLGTSEHVLAAGDLDGSLPDELITSLGIRTGGSLQIGYSPHLPPEVAWVGAVVTDLDADGVADVAVFRRMSGPGQGATKDLDVLLNRHNGSLTFAPVLVETLGPVVQLETGDFDANRAADLLVVERRSAETVAVSVAYGNFLAAPDDVVDVDDFATEVRVLPVGPRAGVASGLVGDAYVDLGIAAIPDGGAMQLGVLYGTANRVLSSPQWGSIDPNVRPQGVVAYPFADPTRPELVGASIFGLDSSDGTATQWVWAGTADGAFITDANGRAQSVLASERMALVVARTDAAPVIVSLNSARYLSTGYGSSEVCAAPAQQLESISNTAPVATNLHVADLDGDQRDELLISLDGTSSNRGIAQTWIAPALTGCAVAAPSTWTDLDAAVEAEACVDATGIDLVTQLEGAQARELAALCSVAVGGNYRAQLRFVARQPDGTLARVGAAVATEGDPLRVVAGDVTGDGVQDLVVLARIGAVSTLQLFVQCSSTDDSCD